MCIYCSSIRAGLVIGPAILNRQVNKRNETELNLIQQQILSRNRPLTL